MLSNRQNVVCSKSSVVIAPLASVDICDIDTSADDDDDNDDSTTTITTHNNSNGLPTIRLNNNNNCSSNHNQHNQYAPTAMNGNHRLARPTTINLKPITCENAVKVTSDKDITDGCFHGATDDSEYSSTGQGINIQFQDIIYRARREISWDRCKYRSH